MNEQTAHRAVPPLTHHDIIRRAAPLTRKGLKVNLAACDRAKRYVEFVALAAPLNSAKVVHTLEVDEDNNQLLTRLVIHPQGLVSSLSAVAEDLDTAFAAFEQIPLTRQMHITDSYVTAYSYTLEPEYRGDIASASVLLQFACSQVGNVELRVDTSTGGGMPADVRISWQGVTAPYLPETLADGNNIPLDHRAAHEDRLAAFKEPINATSVPRTKFPDDILAILGQQWRPLRFQGDHWKGVLRQLSTHEKRTKRAEKFIDEAVQHLANTFATPSEQYQTIHKKARWQVYMRRLQPVMVFVGILALMPISWFFVSSGTVSIHPLALGLTPLLMVGVVVLTAREIPVMEIPPTPAPLPADAWKTAHSLPLTDPDPVTNIATPNVL